MGGTWGTVGWTRKELGRPTEMPFYCPCNCFTTSQSRVVSERRPPCGRARCGADLQSRALGTESEAGSRANGHTGLLEKDG